MSDYTDESDPTPRPSLARDLSAIYHTPFDVTAIDRSILNDARAHLARHVRRRRVMRWSIGLGSAAAAAAVMLAVFVYRPERGGGGDGRQLASVQGAPPAASADVTRVVAGDVNGDGRV